MWAVGAADGPLRALVARLPELEALEPSREWVVISEADLRPPATCARTRSEPPRSVAWRWRSASARVARAAGRLSAAHRRLAGRLAALSRRLVADAAPPTGLGALARLLLLAPLLGALVTLLLVERLADLVVQGLLFPLGVVDRWLRLVAGEEAQRALRLEAEVWVLPWDGPGRDGTTLVVVDERLVGTARWRVAGREALARLRRATLVAVTSASTYEALRACGLSHARLRLLTPGDPRAWSALIDEAAEIATWPPLLDERRVEPWPAPARVEPPSAGPPEVLLFLQEFAMGGVLEATRDLVPGLVALSAERGTLRLRLGLLARDDPSTRELVGLGGGLPIERFRLSPLTRREAQGLLGEEPAWLASGPSSYVFFGDAAAAALRADAWFGLTGGFPLPLLPARPYGVLVYDVIQKHLPDAFPPLSLEHQRRGTAPTARGARLVVTTSPATRLDVIEHHALDPDRVRLVPVAGAVGRRFLGIQPRAVPAARAPFILNVAYGVPHKGAERLLRGFARLLARGGRGPQLVVCGYSTELFSPSCPTPAEGHAGAIRALVRELGLEEPADVVFLGYVDEPRLRDLLGRAAVVVNAALHDNGSFSLTEARWFGRPTASTRYPAAAYLCERFGVPARLFEPDDPDGLADALEQAMRHDRPLEGEELARVRAGFEDPELSHRRYVERIYDALEELAREARAARPALPSPG